MANKLYTLRFREVNRDIFKAIKNGKKGVETRAATKRYADIKSGDMIIFVCGRDKFEKKVKMAKVFKSVSALLNKYKAKQINPFVKSAEELEKMYNSFSGYEEKIKKYGLIALELK